MNRRTFTLVRWAYTAVLLLALAGFLYRGILPPGSGAYADLTPAEGHLFRAVSWTGFVATLGFLMLPWWPQRRD